MNRFSFLFLMLLALGNPPQAFAGDEDDCSVCMSDTKEDLAATQCSKNHKIHEDCLKHQVKAKEFKTKEEAEKVKREGLPCHGAGDKCKGKIFLQDVKGILGHTDEFKDFEKRLNSALSSCNQESSLPPLSPASGHLLEDPHAKKVLEFQSKVAEAFNLCCPNCHGVLTPQVEGCYAATCEGCNSQFCFLCLKQQANSTAAHGHVRGHSNDYWERRDGHTGRVPGAGQNYQEVEEYFVTETDPHTRQKRQVRVTRPYKYLDRYHWMIAREKLESLFQSEPDSSVREKALESLKPLLQKNKMWPLPLGLDTGRWIHEVQAKDSGLDQKNQIALLQNESIYLNHQSEHAQSEALKQESLNRADLVKAALMSLDAPILTSLDVNPHQAPVPTQNQSVIPLIANHPDARVRALVADLQQNRPQFYAMGGNAGRMYLIRDPENRVAPFVLSDAVPRTMNHYEAEGGRDPRTGVEHTGHCRGMGERQATEAELRALERATSPNGQYDRNAIAGLHGTYVWSSSVHDADSAFYFYGPLGHVGSDDRDYGGGSVRCVRPVAAW